MKCGGDRSNSKRIRQALSENDLLQFVKSWWVRHIQNQDRKYAPYLNAVARQPAKMAYCIARHVDLRTVGQTFLSAGAELESWQTGMSRPTDPLRCAYLLPGSGSRRSEKRLT